MDKDNNENSSSKKLEVLLDLETEALFLHEKIDEFIIDPANKQFKFLVILPVIRGWRK